MPFDPHTLHPHTLHPHTTTASSDDGLSKIVASDDSMWHSRMFFFGLFVSFMCRRQ